MGAPAWFDGFTPSTKAVALNLSLDHMPPSMVQAHRDLSPDGPDHLPVFFEKVAAMWASEPQMTREDLSQIAAPTLVILGDDDVLTVEHAATMGRPSLTPSWRSSPAPITDSSSLKMMS